MHTPLADRIRPQSLDDVVGQEHILGKDRLLGLKFTDFRVYALPVSETLTSETEKYVFQLIRRDNALCLRKVCGR